MEKDLLDFCDQQLEYIEAVFFGAVKHYEAIPDEIKEAIKEHLNSRDRPVAIATLPYLIYAGEDAAKSVCENWDAILSGIPKRSYSDDIFSVVFEKLNGIEQLFGVLKVVYNAIPRGIQGTIYQHHAENVVMATLENCLLYGKQCAIEIKNNLPEIISISIEAAKAFDEKSNNEAK